MTTPRTPDWPSALNGGEDTHQNDGRVGEIRHDVERDEGGPTHDAPESKVPPRDDDEEIDEGEGEGRPAGR